MSTYLADSIRAIAANPDPMALRRLPGLANQVERMETCLDQIVGGKRRDLLPKPIRRPNEKRVP
ncbi:MAG TPA: hypothetical protein VHU42_18460 [Rhodopila sp.]|jgi:hypothetical protein|nr:hypothetical protein [Rhodopila sp.]